MKPQVSLHICLPHEQALCPEQVMSLHWETRCVHIWWVHPGLGGLHISGVPEGVFILRICAREEAALQHSHTITFNKFD